MRFVVALLLATCAAAQTGTIRGQVADESGAIIPGAKVTLNGPSGARKNAIADTAGMYSFAVLIPGAYTVQAAAPGLAQIQPKKIAVQTGVQTVNLVLRVATRVDQVTVNDDANP